jgi:hypothetical protein
MTTTNPPAAQAGSYRVGGLGLNRIGYGAMQLAGPGVFGPPRDRAAPIEVLRTAVELGVNHIDTADAYGPYRPRSPGCSTSPRTSCSSQAPAPALTSPKTSTPPTSGSTP